MKKAFLSLMLLFAASVATNTVNAQATTVAAAPVEGGAKIEFKKETHDYGTIKNGADGSCTFEFKNTGDSPLIISNAKGSCGCTVPEWPKEPIAPGATGSIKVKYDTMRTGAINKSVTITSNATNSADKIVFIKGEVLAPETVTPPVNNAGAPTNN
jgi:hypothetical protein